MTAEAEASGRKEIYSCKMAGHGGRHVAVMLRQLDQKRQAKKEHHIAYFPTEIQKIINQVGYFLINNQYLANTGKCNHRI